MLDFQFLTYFWLLLSYFIIQAYCIESNSKFRANVTLKLGLSTDFSTECDDTVYKVVICAGEFTNQCQLTGPISRFTQTTCAFQGPPESISFLVSSVENPIELKVTVQKVGEQEIQQLRNTEFRLAEEKELSVTSSDLSLIVRFHVTYLCLPNYFGKLCNKFCNIEAIEYQCDHLGNMLCKPGYYMDQKLQICRLDQCINHKNYCLNNGLCMNNPNIDATDLPLCICSSNYKGLRCESKTQIITNRLVSENLNNLPLKTNEFNKTNSLHHKNLFNITKTTDNIDHKPKDSINNQQSKLIHSRNYSTPLIPFNQYPLNSINNHSVPISTISPIVSFTEIIVPINNNHHSKIIHEQNWRKIIIISSIGLILIITIGTGCVGLVLCLMRRKPKTDKKSNISSIITHDSGCNYKSARQWTSIDQSPTDLNYYDSSDCRIFPGNTNNGIIDTGAAYPTPFSEPLLQTSTNIDRNYGMYDFSFTPNYYQNQHQGPHHQEKQNQQQREQQIYRHSSIGTTGYHSELLNENGFTTIPKDLYLSNRYMTWNATAKQPPCYATSVKQSSLDKRNYAENFEDGYNGRSMINLNSYRPNDPYKMNEHSRFPVNLDNPIFTNNNDNTINDNTSRYLQPSYNPLLSSIHDSYITNGYFDQLPNMENDYTNQNDNYAINDSNNYLLYKPVQDTINLNSNNYNQIHMNSSNNLPNISITSSLSSKAPPLVQAVPLSPAPLTQFSDLNHY
uniref:Delta-like protein n=1 Tax=Schistosoma mansoni TaxID=6183 RepID=A0A3Q0KTF1_SCHMA